MAAVANPRPAAAPSIKARVIFTRKADRTIGYSLGFP
jgi:hypothetical protein